MKTSTLRAAVLMAGLAIAATATSAASTLGFTASTSVVNESAGTVTLTVSRTGSTAGAVSVNYSLTDVTASSGSDYTATAGTLNWADGVSTSRTIVVPIVNDSNSEPSETFTVTLSGATGGATIGSFGSSTVTITDDETSFSLAASSASVGEGDGTVSLTVNRTGDLSQSASVNFTTTAGSATAGADFVATTGTLNFASGESSKSIVVTINEDTADDELETFTVTLSAPTVSGNGTALLGATTASIITITDNDGALSIQGTETAATPTFGSTITLAATFTGATSLTESAFTAAWTRGTTGIIAGGRYSFTTTNPNANSTRVALVITDANATDNGTYRLTLSNGEGESQSFETTVTVAQTETTRDPNTTALGIANSSHSVTAFLPLPDGRVLLGMRGAITGSDSTLVNFNSSYGIVVLGIDGRVTNSNAGSLNAKINAFHRLPDGKILVAGDFVTLNNSAADTNGKTRLIRLNADFTLDTTFLPSPAPTVVGGSILKIASDDQGRIYLGGSFVDYGGDSSRDLLVRLYADGLLDKTFNRAPAVTQNASVNALFRQPDGKIVVAGNLSQLAGDSLAIPGIYRLNADGSLDLEFNPQVGAGSQFSHAVVDSENRIVLARINPTQAVVRLLSTGVTDTAFTPPGNFNGEINALLPLPDDRLLVGGKFGTVTSGTAVTTARRFIRLNSTGAIDTAYTVGDLLGGGSGYGVDRAALAVNGRVYLAGTFTSYPSTAEAANRILVLEGSTPAVAITAQPEGQAQPAGGSATFRVSATGKNGFTYAWFKDGEALTNGGRISGATGPELTITNLQASDSADYTVTVTTPDSPTARTATSHPALLTVITTPEIITPPADLLGDINGSITLSVLARGGGTLSYQWFFEEEEIPGATSSALVLNGLEFDDAGFYSVRVTNSFGSATSDVALLTVTRRPGVFAAELPTIAASGDVHALLKLADGSILVGGDFTSITVGGTTYTRNRIARFLANGAIDTSFNPTFPDTVRALAQDSAGRVFVGGDFSSVTFGTTTTNYRRVLRLTSSLTVDPAFNGTVGINPGGNVFALAPVGDGSVFVGGTFTSFAGNANANRIALLGTTGTVNTTFANGANGNVTRIVNALAYADGFVYVGGENDALGSPALFVKLSATNGALQSFPSLDNNTTINELAIASDLGLILGGRVGTAGSPTPYFRRINLTTNEVTNLAVGFTGSAASSDVNALARQSDGQFLIGASDDLLRLTTAGVNVSSNDFDDFSGSRIFTLTVDNSGRIWVGGNFSKYGSADASRLAVLAGGAASSTTGERAPQTIDFPAIPGGIYNPAATPITLSATASSHGPITYSVSGPASVDGSTLTITGAGTIEVTATQAGDASFAPASATRSFTITKANQTITFPAIAKKRVSSPAFVLQATTTAVGLAVRFEVSGPATLGPDGVTLTLTGVAGTVTVTAYQDGTANYRPADPKTNTFLVEDVSRLSQTITFAPPAARTFGSAAAPVVVSTNARGLTVMLTVLEGPGELGPDNRTLTLTGAGTVRIRASQAGDADYLPATSIIRDIVVNKARQTITFNLPTTLTLGNPAPILAATSSAGPSLPITYALGTGNNAATLSEGVLTVTGAGKIVVVASQAGNDNYLPATSVTKSIVVSTPRLVLSGLTATYNGEPHAVTVTGAPLDYADDVVVTYQLGSGIPTTVAPTTAGNYRVVATLGTAKTTGTLKIAKKALTITPRNKTLLVGTTIPTGSAAIAFFPVDYSGFVEGEDVSDIATQPIPFANASATSKAGTNYKIRARGGLDENYSFTYLEGALTLVGLAGNYQALLIDDEERPLGLLNLSMLNNSFGYTGSLALAAENSTVAIRSTTANPALSGEFTEEGVSATGIWSRAATSSLPALLLTLQVDSDGSLGGIVLRGGQPYATLANGRLLRSAATGAAGVGAYTFVLAPSDPQTGDPEGAGYASGTIAASGSLSLRGKLADGTILSASSRVDTANAYRLFVKPHGARPGNALGGYLPLEATSPTTYHVDDAEVFWVKPGLNSDASYRSGIDVGLSANLDLWRAPVSGVSLAQRLGLAATAGLNGPFLIDFICGGLTEGMVSTLPSGRVLLPNNSLQAVATAENPSSFALTLTPGTGLFSGSFRLVIPPATTARQITFSGALRQPAAGASNANLIGRGYFLLPGATTAEPSTSGEIRFEIPTVD